MPSLLGQLHNLVDLITNGISHHVKLLLNKNIDKACSYKNGSSGEFIVSGKSTVKFESLMSINTQHKGTSLGTNKKIRR